MKNKKIAATLLKVLYYLIFWAWNIIFVVFIASLVIPTMGVPIVKAFFAGMIPTNFFLILIFGIIVPIISIILGLTKFRKEPKKLFQLFYGIEIPLGVVLILRLALFKELNPGTSHVLFLFVIGTLVYLFDLYFDNKNKIVSIFRFIGDTVLLVIGIYFSAILLFYFFPAVFALIKYIFTFEWIKIFKDIFMAFSIFIGFLFVIVSSSVLIILPIAMPTLFIKKFISGFKRIKQNFSLPMAISISSVVIALNILLYLTLNIQPQKTAYNLILMQDDFSDSKKIELLEQKNKIRKGLLNSYLASYRYISTNNDNDHIEVMYENVFGINEKPASGIQNFYNFLMQPFLYKGNSFYLAEQQANDLYENFFDAPIQKSETKPIKHALQATWNRDAVEAGLLNIDDKNVYILQQEITITEKDGIAEIEICEFYENKTPRLQEIFYYFNLPENAVLTGLWLSDAQNEQKIYEYIVSPRGAAQQIYKEQVREQIDPSLLEQTGLRQYRLRAFPIPTSFTWTSLTNEDTDIVINNKLKLWLRYVCVENNGEYALPQLSEKRNVYWDKKTVIKLNNEEIKRSENWLPKKITAQTKLNITQAVLNDSTMLKISKISDKNINPLDIYSAIIIDQSYSMKKSKDELTETIENLKNDRIKSDIFIQENNSYRKINIHELNTDDIIFFGKSNYYDELNSFKKQFSGTEYNSIIFITDKGSYELNEDNYSGIDFNIPVYFLHLNNEFPSGYSDAIIETIQNSGGGIAGNTNELLNKIYTNEKYKDTNIIYDSELHILGTITKIDSLTSVENYSKNVAQIFGSQYINMLIRESDSISLEMLDKIHTIAKQNGIVTPYSSMIVLVNDQQKQDLEEAELEDDRFEREVETGKETLTKTNDLFNVNGVPEPEEWILISIAGLFLILIVYFKVKK